jgi:hypothetical protein
LIFLAIGQKGEKVIVRLLDATDEWKAILLAVAIDYTLEWDVYYLDGLKSLTRSLA